VNGFVNFVKTLGVGRIAALTATFAAMMAFMLFLSLRLAEPKMAPLYGKLEQDDAVAIVAKLDALKIPYELKGDGTLITVPEDRVLKLRMTLAEAGLPSGGSAGYELFDKQDSFSATSFTQDINRLRALEGELARTIRSIDTIEAARVHLVLPKRELFASEQPEPTASIVLRTRRGALGRGQVKAIQNLVASAVEGLAPGRVTILDEQGRLLAAASDKDPQAAETTAIDERTADYENRLRGEVEEIVARVVGPGRARVQVSAEMDYNRVTQSEETYDPDGQVVRSTQTVDEKTANQDAEHSDGNAVSVGNKLPDNQAPADNTKTTSKANTSRTEETVNYEISKSTKTQVLEVGRVKRLSVAVLVDGAYAPGKDGGKTYTSRNQDELDKITTLVRSAIGFNEKRGDQVTVVNLPFATADTDEALVAEKKPFLGLETTDLIRIGESLGLVVVALMMVLFVFRPMIARLTGIAAAGAGRQAPLALADGSAPAQMPAGAAMAVALPQGMAAPIALASAPASAQVALPPRQSQVSQMIDLAQVEGQVKESSVRKVGEIINNHPEEAVSILRTWLYQGE
jgi:flagellar M-ring protein FliF